MNSIEEIFSKEEQRYVLINKKILLSTYYSVPSALGINKKTAMIFHKYWSIYLGNSFLLYTKSIKGRKVLFEDRKRSFDYSGNRNIFNKKKKALVDKIN